MVAWKSLRGTWWGRSGKDIRRCVGAVHVFGVFAGYEVGANIN